MPGAGDWNLSLLHSIGYRQWGAGSNLQLLEISDDLLVFLWLVVVTTQKTKPG